MVSYPAKLIVLLALFSIIPSCASDRCNQQGAESMCAQCGAECEGSNCAQCTARESDKDLPLLGELFIADPELLSDQDQIKLVIEAQQAAWNKGDIEGFMDGYWRSDELVFTSGDRIRRGWQATLDGYKLAYKPDAMGQLTFSDLEIVPTADNESVVVGHWALTGLEGDPQGEFTLVFRKFLEGWRITRDHTTSD